MSKQQDDKQMKFFVDAFHGVVIPVLDNMATKDDIAKIREEMVTKDDLDNAVDKIERRIDKIDDRLDRHGKTLDEHEKKIEKIGTHIGIVPS